MNRSTAASGLLVVTAVVCAVAFDGPARVVAAGAALIAAVAGVLRARRA